jgi:hypothetical protein
MTPINTKQQAVWTASLRMTDNLARTDSRTQHCWVSETDALIGAKSLQQSLTRRPRLLEGTSTHFRDASRLAEVDAA